MAQLPDTKRLQQLARKFLQGTISDAEQQELNDWFLSKHALQENPTQVEFTEDEHRRAIFDRIQGEIRKSSQQKTRSLWPRIAAAASIILAVSIGSYFLLHKKQSVQQIAQNQIHDVVPGQNQATLTLANGKKIILIKGLAGKLAVQGRMLIQINAGSGLTYTAQSAASTNQVQYNTLSTRRGQESPFPVTLADGSKVWLNAASSITYPTSFEGTERMVKITGEAYFEVVHNAAHPFKVAFNNQIAEDIGTSFDINAYNDEPSTKTTVITGSVKLTSAAKSVVLKPGTVAIVAQTDGSLIVRNADTDEAVAWKNGYFMFDSENLESVMRKVSRWYDVDVEYVQGQQMDERYLGSISRFSNVSKVLQMLEMTGDVKFKIEGKKIIVQKK